MELEDARWIMDCPGMESVLDGSTPRTDIYGVHVNSWSDNS
jgi:hypothetical protein